MSGESLGVQHTLVGMHDPLTVLCHNVSISGRQGPAAGGYAPGIIPVSVEFVHIIDKCSKVRSIIADIAANLPDLARA